VAEDPDPVRAAVPYGLGGAGGTDWEAPGWSGQAVAVPGGAGVPLTCGIAGFALAIR